MQRFVGDGRGAWTPEAKRRPLPPGLAGEVQPNSKPTLQHREIALVLSPYTWRFCGVLSQGPRGMPLSEPVRAPVNKRSGAAKGGAISVLHILSLATQMQRAAIESRRFNRASPPFLLRLSSRPSRASTARREAPASSSPRPPFWRRAWPPTWPCLSARPRPPPAPSSQAPRSPAALPPAQSWVTSGS